jgi:hypothetical protein
MDGAKRLEVFAREFKKRRRRSGPSLARVDERAGELNQPLVVWRVRLSPAGQPQRFEDLVRLKIQPAIEHADERQKTRMGTNGAVSHRDVIIIHTSA